MKPQPKSSFDRWAWLVWALPMVASAATRDLWAPDEPRYAQVAKEIFERGDAIVMHLCGEVYPNKPPLLFWLSGVLGWLSDWSELAMRSVSLASIAVTAWLVARIARSWWGEREAAVAPVFYLVTTIAIWHGGRLQIDPLLCALCTGALVLLAEPAASDRSARWRARAAGLAIGLGVLAKGPVAFLFVLAPLLAWRALLGPRPGPRPRLAWLDTAVLAIVPPLAWAGAVVAKEPQLARDLFFGQHLERAVEGTHHARPFWYHLEVQPAMFLPWTLALIAALALAWRAWRDRRAGRESDAGLVRAGAWFGLLFVVFSAITEKRDLYFVPIAPAAALLLARWLSAFETRATRARWIAIPTAALLAALGAAVCAAPWFEPRWVGKSDAPVLGWRLPAIGVAMLAPATIALHAAWRDRPRGWFLGVATSFAGAWTVAALLAFPAINPSKSAKDLSRWLAARPERPSAIPCVGVGPEAYRFYGAGPTVEGALREAIARDGAKLLALLEESKWRKLDPSLRAKLVELRRERVGSRTVVVAGARNHAP